MTIKNTLTLAEYKAFVDTVVNSVFITTETGETEYHPEYEELFNKYAIVKYYTDYDFEKFYDLCETEEVKNAIYTVMLDNVQFVHITKAIEKAIDFKKNMLYKQ